MGLAVQKAASASDEGNARMKLKASYSQRFLMQILWAVSYTHLLLVGLAVVLTIVFYVSAPTLLRLFGASDATLTYATDYALSLIHIFLP